MWLHGAAALCAIVVFLLGLRVMRTGLEALSTGKLQELLQRLVNTPTKGILTGTVATMFTQSSSAVTAICVSIVASQAMTFQDAVGVVLGSNVGSTITPQILTFNLWTLMIPCLVAGGLGLFARRPRVRSLSLTLIGFAAIYISLQVFSLACASFAEKDWFESFLLHAGQHVWLAVIFGCLASAVLQSSTAITVLTMSFTADGLLPLAGGIAVVLGANVGTCLTSVIAALGQSREAKQVALSHVLLNVLGVAVALPLIHPFTALIALLETNPSRQIADAHTLFNVASTLAAWPFVGWFAQFVTRWV